MLVACSDPVARKHEVRPLKLSADETALVEAQNSFSLDLLRSVAKAQSGENIFISPLSAAVVSAMLANGAKGETQDEILRAIGADDCDLSALNAYYLNLMENLPYQDETTTVLLANALWLDYGYPVNPVFADEIRTHYLASVDSLELSDPASASLIDAWASKHTNGLINKITHPELFTDDLHLVLANALYFKGQWHERFKKTNTSKKIFHAASGDVSVEMMHGEVEARVSGSYIYNSETDEVEEQGARVLRLFYQDKGYCMDIVLPDAESSTDRWLSDCDFEWIDKMLYYSMGKADVTMPKFTLRGKYRLNEPMQALGMRKVFTGNADLSGVSDASGLYLALLQQDTYVEVDEDGTKAAATTSGWLMDKAEESSAPFVVDRPFLFFIRDVKHGIVLFAGIVSEL